MDSKLALLAASLASLTACSTAARAPVQPPANSIPSTRYTLVPLALRGNEGMHSASHSSTSVTGALTVTGDRAELVLESDSFVSYVYCSPELAAHSMQQCASPDARPSHHVSQRVLRGTTRAEDGALVLALASEAHARGDHGSTLELTCRDSYLGLACTIGATDLFGFGVMAKPSTMAFATPGTKRLAIVPVQVKDVGLVTGSLAMDGGAIALTLAVDGGAPTTLPGTAAWVDHGVALSAQTSPTRNLGASCTVEGDRLRCEVTGDRSILGKPEHIYSEMTLVPEAPAPMPMRAPSSTMGA